MKQFSKSIVLVVIMSLIGFNSFASVCIENADGVKIYYNFDYSDNVTKAVVTVASPAGSYAGDIVIPEEIIYRERSIKVTAIDKSAFGWCPNLTSVSIPNTVKTIGDYAFYNDNLTSLTIGSGVTFIGNSAFSNCTIDSVFISDIAAWCNIDFSEYGSQPRSSLYLNGELLSNLIIPEGVTAIGCNAFYGCPIENVTIPNSVTTIGDHAFYDCSIRIVFIPNSVTSIGEYAFENPYSLNKVIIGSNVTSIGSHAFNRSGYYGSVEAVFSLIEEPFEIPGISDIDNSPFSKTTFEETPLYVPVGTLDKYKATKGWKDFKIIEEATSVIGVKRETTTSSRYYTIDGRQVDGDPLSKGIYIQEGRKVVVK